MTRVASSLNKQMLARRVVEPDQLWWFREAHNLPNGVAPYWVSDLKPDGTVIHRVSIQVGIEPGGVPEQFTVHVFLAASQRMDIGTAIRSEQIINFSQLLGDVGYYPMCDDCEIQFPIRRTIVGSNQRLGIAMINASNKVASCRVGILYSQP